MTPRRPGHKRPTTWAWLEVFVAAIVSISSLQAMATGIYRDLFVVIATSAATLIGLLFVALSVSESRAGSRPKVVRQFRAAASFVAFINPSP